MSLYVVAFLIGFVLVLYLIKVFFSWAYNDLIDKVFGPSEVDRMNGVLKDMAEDFEDEEAAKDKYKDD